MNILIISNLYPPYILGGYEILCAQVVTYLTSRGHNIHVLTSDHGGATSDNEVTRTLKVYQSFDKAAHFQRKSRINTARHNEVETKKIIREKKPDVIFIWSLLRLTPSSAHVAQRSNIPTIFTFNDENIMSFAFHPFSFRLKQLAHWFLDLLTPSITLKGIDFTYSTCISNILKNNLLNRGLPIQDSEVIYQGIPVEKFPLKKDPGKGEEVAKLLYVGQLHPYKGVHTILEALTLLHHVDNTYTCSLTIVGKGEEAYTQTLKERASSLPYTVEFKGLVPHDQVPTLYREHDIFIFPSIWQEPFGLTHLEAMASGLAVISTANGGQGEFLIDGENALTFSPDNPKELALQLEKVLTDPSLYQFLVEKGRWCVEKDFAFDRYVDEIERLLQRACQSTQVK